MINFKEWEKLDLRVGQIKEVKQHPNADKLLLLRVDLGEKEIQLVAGIKQYYSNEELKDKKIVVITNLEPAMLRGQKSEGMLLAADDKANNKVVLICPEKDVPVGTKIR